MVATSETLLESVQHERITFIELWFTDITGVVKNVTIPAAKLAEVLAHGMSFDGSSLDAFARVAESDMLLMPDVNTFALLPWSDPTERTARLICTVYTPQGEPFIGDSRTVLLKALGQAAQMGYSFKTGMELEFFIFNQGAPHDQAGYFDLPTEPTQQVRRQMLGALNALNIPANSAHSEIGHGQHEIDLDYTHALTSADNVLTARVALKTVAQQYGLHCTFMPRPSAILPGSGMHTHQSLHDVATGANVFMDTS
ncbi:MAG: glutamine synthetase, partial [Armatimonadetes bacterium]|nr:glutamine synthetase [Anaerolineae bacterium]